MASLLLALAVAYPAASPARGGTVTLDGSYGTSGALTGPNYQITAGMGRQMGNNLFQSFGLFSLVNGDTATFSGPANIQNILARVTGGSPSSIDGTITSTIAGANLFLLNPSGVMFGPHAAINLTGSFAVSTANYVKFSDGGIFYAQLGNNDVLSSAPVSAFGFLTATPQPVTFSGTQLNMQPATGLHVIGGDVSLDDASLLAPGGALTIFSAAGAGEVPFNLASPGTGFANATVGGYGAISLTNGSQAEIDSPTGGGGSVVIRGGKLTVDQSNITSGNFGPVAGGNIAVQADSVTVSNGGYIATDSFNSANAGSVTVQVAGNLSVTGSSAAGIGSQISADTERTGAGGVVTVKAGGSITLAGGGSIFANTDGTGNCGAVDVQGGSMSVGENCRLSSVSDGGGNAGTLDLDLTGDLTMTGNSAIVADTYTAGNGGSVTVQAGRISLADESLISANTLFSSGTGGNILVEAGSLTIDSGSSVTPAGITAQAISSSGNAGTVDVVTGGLSLNGAAVISTSAIFSGGNGGSVSVACAQGALSGRSSISASSTYTNAGSVQVKASQSLSLDGDSTLDTSAGGNGGNITLQVGQLLYLHDSTIEAYAGVAANSGPTVGGNGGNILIDPELVVLDHSLISANDLSPIGHDGNIVNFTDYFLSSNSTLFATGTINTTPPDLDLVGGLLVLSGNLIDVKNRLRENCAQSINHEFSTFTVVGRGGTETGPNELRADFGLSLRP